MIETQLPMKAPLMSMFRAVAAAMIVLAAGLAAPSGAQAQAAGALPSEGELLYKEHCAVCHENAESRAPSRANLKAMSFQTIEYALTEGKMKDVGAKIAPASGRAVLITYLTGHGPSVDDKWTDQMMCPTARRQAVVKGPATIGGFGFDKPGTRALAASQAGLSTNQLSNLELAWSIAIPGESTMRSQPAVVGKTVFLPVAAAAAMYAFDVSNPAAPCVKWVFKTPGGAPLRTSASYGILPDGRGVVAFAAQNTTVFLLDATSGKPLWSKKVGAYKYSMSTGTPVIVKNRVIVPVSQSEISFGASNSVKCCDNHGYVVSLDVRSGEQQWRYDTMPDAQPLRDRGDGKMLYGPSGAPIWTSPSVDEKRGLIYFGTGEANSPPVHRNTDAIIAIGLNDGKERWSYQATERDVYLSGCGASPAPTQLNCVSDTVYRDVDFGASFVLGHQSNGAETVFAGQKSGAVWAVEPATGKVLWRTQLGNGGALGGVHWGLAYKGDTVFAPIAQVGRDLPGQPVDPTIKPGMYALDAGTGKIKWSFATLPDCVGDRAVRVQSCERSYGMSAAPVVIDGAVIEGGLDGYLYVLDAKTGKLLSKIDTAIAYRGINGEDGKGGSIDAASVSAVNGLLLVNSGYGTFRQQAGNMLLAFRPKAR